MKKITFILFLLIVSITNAQTFVESIEDDSLSPYNNPKIIKYSEPTFIGCDHLGINTSYTFEVKGDKKNGNPIGKWTITRNDGFVTSLINFNDFGLLHGKIEIFNDFGLLVVKGNFINDLEDGEWVIQNNYNNVKAVGFFKKGKPDGEWKIFYKDVLFETIPFKNGTQNGKFISYDKYEDGKFFIGEIGEFINGEIKTNNSAKENLDDTENFVESGSIIYIENIEEVKPELKQEDSDIEIEEKLFQEVINLREELKGESANGESNYNNGKIKHKWNYNSSLGEELFFYLNGELMIKRNIRSSTNNYKTYIDEYGSSEKYYKNGLLAKKVIYDNDLKVFGKTYYPSGEIAIEINSLQEINKLGDTLNRKKITAYYENGAKKSIMNYLDDVIHGEYITYYENGQIEQKQFLELVDLESAKEVRGVDKFISYYESGKVKEEGVNYNYIEGEKSSGHFIEGSPKGLWKVFYENGQIKKESYYSDNCFLKKIIEYYENDQVKSIINFSKFNNWCDTKNGDYFEYYENGQIKIKGNYKDDKRNGIWITYFPDGKKESEGSYIINHYYISEYNGCTESYYELLSEKLIKDYYSQSNKFGEWKYYHKNGNLKEIGNYKSNKQELFYEASDVIYQQKYYDYWHYFDINILNQLPNKIDVIDDYNDPNTEQYIPEIKTGVWQYFDEKGKIVKTEKY